MSKLTVLDIKCSVARDWTYLTLTSKLIDADPYMEMSAHMGANKCPTLKYTNQSMQSGMPYFKRTTNFMAIKSLKSGLHRSSLIKKISQMKTFNALMWNMWKTTNDTVKSSRNSGLITEAPSRRAIGLVEGQK